MARTRRIGVLTGGGDVPGLNSVIKSVVYRATELGYEVIGIRRGWEGLTHIRPGPSLDPDYLRPLDRINTRTIDRTGGTCAAHLADEPAQDARRDAAAWLIRPRTRRATRSATDVYDLTPLVLDHIARARARLPGDDRRRRHAELRRRSSPTDGVPLIAIPKTMDNDVQGTEYCIGFSSAITRAKELINRQRTTLGSHERIGVFRIFGRDAGFSALFTAYVTSGRCVIPEAPYDLDALAGVLAEDHRPQPEPLRLRHRRRGRDLAGRHRWPTSARPTRSATATRPTSARRWPSSSRARTGIESRRVRADLRPAQRRARLARPDGRDDLRQRGDGPPRRRRVTGRMVAIRDGKYAHTHAARSGSSGRARSTSSGSTTWSASGRTYAGKLGEPLLLLGTPSLTLA